MNSTKTTSMRTSAKTSTDDKPSIPAKVPIIGAERPRRKKVYSSYDHYYHDSNNTARMPTHNYHQYPKKLLEYQNTEHDYKVLKVKAED